jgi:hypothetical protein
MNSEFNFGDVSVEWNEHHATLLKELLSSFDSQGIRYVILKNDEGLPLKNHSKDVDIVIEPGTYSEAEEVIRMCYKNNGVTHYKVHRFERLRCWYGMNPDSHFAIHIDLLEGFLHKGFEMFPFEVLYAHSQRTTNGIQVLDEVMGSVVLLLHSTICYHSIKDKYAKSITKAFQAEKETFEKILKEILGDSVTLEMVELLSTGNFKEIAHRGRYYSHQSKLRLLLRRPFFSIYNVCDFLWEKVCRLLLNLEKYNIMISVHAPDGTGKTTFIEHFGKELGFYYVCAANDLLDTHHFRPCVLPNLGAAAEKVGVMKQDRDFTSPHRAKPAGLFGSFLRMSYYWLDYMVGIPLILRKNAQFNKITIFDRYVYDLISDPERTRIDLPLWLRKKFVNLTKEPNIVFILEAEAETIRKRKQELSVDEINNQLESLHQLAILDDKFHILDAMKTPEEMAKEAIKITLDITTNKLV